MNTNQNSFFDRVNHPVFQASLALAFALFGMVVAYLLKVTGAMDVGDRAPWIIAGTTMLLYAMFSSVISLGAKDMNQYWFRSTASYTVLTLVCSGLAYLFSSLTITEAGSFKFIFTALTFGYLLFLSITRFMRKIVQLAQKADDKWEDGN